MHRAWIVAPLAFWLTASLASAGNSDQVNAGLDVTLTGDAVVANVYTGASLWYNPAGVARLSKTSLELTGVTLTLQVLNAPGLVTLDTDPAVASEGKNLNFSVIPRALTFMIRIKENLKLGVGLFTSSLRREYLGERVEAPGTSSTPSVEAVAGRESRVDFFHVSTGLAGEFGKKQKVLFGGAFDLVISTDRVSDTYSVFYDNGAAGQVSRSAVETQTGFGLQMKAGIQWVPIEKVRIGLSIATPSYLFAVLERYVQTSNQAPPAGTVDDENPQLATAAEDRSASGGWWGVQPGNLRFGVAYVRSWGWIEADMLVQLPLLEEGFDIDFSGAVDARFGSALRLSKSFQLGLGAFTDFGQVNRLTTQPLGTRKVDFYGLHLGFLYSNQEVHPNQDEPEEKDGLGISLALGLRYSFGKGDAVGLLLPPEYDPSAISVIAVPIRINELAVNIAVKVAF